MNQATLVSQLGSLRKAIAYCIEDTGVRRFDQGTPHPTGKADIRYTYSMDIQTQRSLTQPGTRKRVLAFKQEGSQGVVSIQA